MTNDEFPPAAATTTSRSPRSSCPTAAGRLPAPPVRAAAGVVRPVAGARRPRRRAARHVAALHLGDPEQFWRIADANGAIAPEQLTDEPGRRLRITLPAGVPGAEEG